MLSYYDVCRKVPLAFSTALGKFTTAFLDGVCSHCHIGMYEGEVESKK